MLESIKQLAENGYSINQVSRALKTYDTQVRRIIKADPELEKKLKDNGTRRKLQGVRHNG